MWRNVLGSFGIEHYMHVLSPAFFRVLPPRKLWRRARSLVAGSRDGDLYAKAWARRAQTLATVNLGVRLASEPSGGDLSAQRTAAAVVQLYFHQIFSPDTSLIDLRAESFGVECASW